MDLKLNGRVALVTGTASQIGYGKKIAETLAAEGCELVISDFKAEGLQKTAQELEQKGYRVTALQADVTDRAQVDNMVKSAIDKFGHVDILVNNAGASNRMMPFLQMTKKEWEFEINTNLYGQLNVAQSILPHMMARHSGRIINTSGGQGIPTLSMYGAAKAAVVAWTRAVAKEVAPSGVIMTVYSPGLGPTGLTAHDPRMPEMAKASFLGRLCQPEDIGPLVAFLASDVGTYYAMILAGTAMG